MEVVSLPRKKRSGLKDLAEVFALIGAVFLIVFSIISLIGISLALPWIFHGEMIVFSLSSIINSLILILIGLIIFAGYDIIKISLKMEMEWPILLVLGIVALIFGGGLGALLILLAAIIDLIA